MIDYTISNSNLHLVDSYKLRKKEFRPTLDAIQLVNPEYDVWKRWKCGMCCEWATHNALHSLGLWEERTRSVDLNYPQSLLEKVAYAIVGCLVWPFIK
ncbi:MAG: hypothetical protein II636_04150 [Bacteroidales bacterium]|nr:hypothetical protein [Bacteroidales bacterium]